MKHLKLFETEVAYTQFKDTDDYVLPNVSYVEETKVVKYDRKKAYILRATYNATPDNLVAFTGASNIKSLNINGTPIKIEPIKNEITTFDVLGENISMNMETGEATFPESYLVKSPVSSWSFKAKDPNYTITENTFICMLGMMDGMTMAQPMSPEEMNYMFTTNDGVTIEVIDEFLNEMNAQIAMGLQIGFTLMDVDMDNQTFTFIDTEHQTNITTGGMSTYSFDSEGLYDVKIELADSDVKNIRFAGTPLTSIEISDDITSIGEGVFYDNYQSCDSLTSVTIGSGVTTIENYAFQNCRSLTSVYISDIAAWCNISFIGSDSNPLYYAHNLYLNNKLVTDLIIPDSVTSIGNCAFYNCSSLTSVTFGDSVTEIGDWAFNGCSGLTSITCYAQTAPTIYNNTFNYINKFGTLYYPEGSDYSNWLSRLRLYYWNMMITAQYTVTSSNEYLALSNTSKISHLYVNGAEVTNFGSNYSFKAYGSYTIGIILKDNAGDIQNMFENVKSLNSVIIDNSITSIGNYAFYNCTNMASVTIPDGVTSIGNYAFQGCNNLTSVTIPDSVTQIGERAFRNCIRMTDITIGDSVTTIGERAFEGCTNMASVTIPDGVTSIGNYAFKGCTSMSSVTIGDSVTSIGTEAFRGCSSLTSVTIPDSVTSIGYGAFSACSSLTSVTIGESVTTIGDYAFSGCDSLTSVTIPDGVTTIGMSAFSSCDSLTSVTIGSGVTTIEKSVFNGCSRLTSIVVSLGNTKYDSRDNCNCLIETATNTIIKGCNNSVIPNSVTSIGKEAFYGCSSLTSITIPNGVIYIDNDAFRGCTGMSSVTIPNSVTSIGAYTFSDCSSLIDVTIPNSVTSIGDSAFRDCSNIESVTIGSGVTTIGYYAFSGCSGLTSIVVSLGNTKYDSRDNCNCLIETATNTIIKGCNNSVIPNSVTSIGNYAFQGCTSMSSVTIGDSVTSIGTYAFSNCDSLTSVTIPDSVTTIEEGAFSWCSSITDVTIGSGATDIRRLAFSYCEGLASITCYAPTAPSIHSETFYTVSKGGTLYVPTGSNYRSWMSTSSYYLGKYNWTIQYI